MNIYKKSNKNTLFSRFRGFYPVVIDVETAGFDAKIDALLEISAITLFMSEEGWLKIDQIIHFHIEPFLGSRIQPESIAFNKIDPYNPLRNAISEYEALYKIFNLVWQGIRDHKCNRGIIVGHNATFDHSFLMAAAERSGIKDKNPFHSFSILDTASLSALTLGQTVLSKACSIVGIPFDHHEAHSALYDAEKTALLFCELVNRWKRLGGWPVPSM